MLTLTHVHFYKPAGSAPCAISIFSLRCLFFNNFFCELCLSCNLSLVHFRGRIHLIISKATDLCQTSFSGALETGNTVVNQTGYKIHFRTNGVLCLCVSFVSIKKTRPSVCFLPARFDACNNSRLFINMSLEKCYSENVRFI